MDENIQTAQAQRMQENLRRSMGKMMKRRQKAAKSYAKQARGTKHASGMTKPELAERVPQRRKKAKQAKASRRRNR